MSDDPVTHGVQDLTDEAACADDSRWRLARVEALLVALKE
jgi:hypothetical protein